jgi:hypothetical protein
LIHCTYGDYSNHNKLTLNWHTGIRIGAASVYGGTAFYNNSTNVSSTVILSVGRGDNNVRVPYALYAASFYDIDNTAYYVDPTSSTSLRTAGAWVSDHAGWTGEQNKIQWHSNNLYIQNTAGGALAIFRGAGGAEKANIDASGNFTASGNITAYSDRRLKENIETIPNAISLVQRLRGVTFDWIADKKHSYGLIAQEVEEVIPELVHETENGTADGDVKMKIKSVDYSKIVSVLIEGMKEQQQQIEHQQLQIEELKALIKK